VRIPRKLVASKSAALCSQQHLTNSQRWCGILIIHPAQFPEEKKTLQIRQAVFELRPSLLQIFL